MKVSDVDFVVYIGVGFYLRDYVFDWYKMKLKFEDKLKFIKVVIGMDVVVVVCW